MIHSVGHCDFRSHSQYLTCYLSYLHNVQDKQGWRRGSSGGRLPGKCEALGLIPNNEKKIKKKKKASIF
jgi:hypothetical protein